MKNYDQTNKAKEKFLNTNTIAQYFRANPNQVFTREELVDTFQMDDRSIRNNVAEMANYLPILSLSKDKGYCYVTFTDETSVEDLVALYERVNHQIKENKSRIDNLKARMKPLVALQKVIEAKVKAKTNA